MRRLLHWVNETCPEPQTCQFSLLRCSCGILELDPSQPLCNEIPYSRACRICSRPICSHPGQVCGSLFSCLDCNPEPKQFKPCGFSCQRHLRPTTAVDGKIKRKPSVHVRHWNEASICVVCHKEHFADDEKRYVLSMNVDPCFTVSESCWSFIAGIGKDKMEYLSECNSFVRSFKRHLTNMHEDNLKSSMNGSELHVFVDTFTEAWYRSIYTFRPVHNRGRINTLPTIHPRRALKALVRVIIIFRRYKEDFCNPDKGNYMLKVGATSFNVKKRKANEVGSADTR